LDLEQCRAWVRKRKINLTATEVNLLACFLQNQGRTLSRKRLLRKVWGSSYQGTARTVDTHVQRLRRKLGRAARRIRTVWGVGYRLEIQH
jgi:two-component system phosphate regulon response regulator PhoB